MSLADVKLRREVLERLKELKKVLGFRSYSDVIEFLIKQYEASFIKSRLYGDVDILKIAREVPEIAMSEYNSIDNIVLDLRMEMKPSAIELEFFCLVLIPECYESFAIIKDKTLPLSEIAINVFTKDGGYIYLVRKDVLDLVDVIAKHKELIEVWRLDKKKYIFEKV